LAFVDHGAGGTGEPLTVMLRTGKAGANTTDDHIKVSSDALAQISSTASGRFGPAGRFLHRWWDGTIWTEHVADQTGRRVINPL